jgi:hypothetical protein
MAGVGMMMPEAGAKFIFALTRPYSTCYSLLSTSNWFLDDLIPFTNSNFVAEMAGRLFLKF